MDQIFEISAMTCSQGGLRTPSPLNKTKCSTLGEDDNAHVFLGHYFRNGELLEQALTHKSFSNENKKTYHNEVLELIGDSVLGLIVIQILFEKFPVDSEGGLTKKRASLVNESFLSEVAKDLGLDARLRVGRGEKNSRIANNPRILASTFEALVGAIYLDAGFEEVSRLLRALLSPLIDSRRWEMDYELDYKSRLQELVQVKNGEVPTYKLQEEVGPEHNKRFEVQVRVGGRVLGLGWGSTKKMAEHAAAKMALEKLQERLPE